MASIQYKCDRCDKEFTSGSWFCEDGASHTVPVKTYHVSTEGLQLFYGAVSGDQVQNRARKVIDFTRGTHTTSDPEKQEVLDKYPGCVSFESWKNSHLSADEIADASKRDRMRLEKTNEELLAKVQELTKAAAAGAQPILAASGKGK